MSRKTNGQFMKRELKCLFTLPHLEEVNRYLVNPTEEWKEDIYLKAQEIALEILNRHQLEFNAKLADYAVCEACLPFVSAEAEHKVSSVIFEYFMPYFAKEKAALEEMIVPSDE